MKLPQMTTREIMPKGPDQLKDLQQLRRDPLTLYSTTAKASEELGCIGLMQPFRQIAIWIERGQGHE